MRRVTGGDGSEHESHDLLTWSCFVCYTFSEVVNVNMSACEVPSCRSHVHCTRSSKKCEMTRIWQVYISRDNPS